MLEKNCPIEIFAVELRRRILESTGNAQEDCTIVSEHLNQIDEAKIVEALAKENGLWVDFSVISSIGTPFPSGVENDVYLSSEGNVIIKINNLMTSRTISALFDRLMIHNSIFPQTKYKLYGFTGFGRGSIYPILCQDFIPNEREATPIEIDTYMAALGFDKLKEGTFSNGQIIISDLHPRNVLRDQEGDLFVVDAEFKKPINI